MPETPTKTLTVEELCEQLEQAMPAEAGRHSKEVKLASGAVWLVTRIKIADPNMGRT
jgi:hypothetical protein